MLVEFELMCGEGAVNVMRENWDKYAPRVLALENDDEFAAMDERLNYRSLEILDKRLRPCGPSGKNPQAFSFYEVWVYTV